MSDLTLTPPISGALPVWHADAMKTSPVLCWCMKRGWPNETTDGKIMYENSHYADEIAAWESIIRNQEAGVSLVASRIKQERAELRRMESDLADEVIRLEETRKAYERRKEEAAKAKGGSQ